MLNLLLITTAAMLVCARNGVLCIPLCLTGDFDSQMRHIVHELTKDPADMLSTVVNDVQTTLNQRWQGCKAIPFGSLMTRLVLPSSDIDLLIQLPLHYPRNSGIVQEASDLFEMQPELYTNIRHFYQGEFWMLQVIHIPSQRNVDLLFNYGEVHVGTSKLFKYYFNLDERFHSLAIFLKFWFNIQSENGRHLPIKHVLYLLIIFYLQQKNMVPSVYMLQKDSKSNFFNNWDMGFNELPYNSTNTENLQQLLGGFFKYYSEFNYEEYAIAPFAGRPIRKSDFKDIENLPEEYTLSSSNLKHKLNQQIINAFNVRAAEACIQECFVHSFVRPLIDSSVLERYNETVTFIHFMKSVANMFEDLPSENILSAILVMDQPKKEVISHKQSSAAGGHEQVCIDI